MAHIAILADRTAEHMAILPDRTAARLRVVWR